MDSNTQQREAERRKQVLLRVRADIDRELADLEGYFRTLARLSGATSSGAQTAPPQSMRATAIIRTTASATLTDAPKEQQSVDEDEDDLDLDGTLSKRNQIVKAAAEIITSHEPDFVSVAELVQALTDRGLVLGYDDASRKRRVTSSLSADGQFEAKRGAGWKMKVTTAETSRFLDELSGGNADGAEDEGGLEGDLELDGDDDFDL